MVLHLDPTAQHTDEVGDDVGLENALVVRLQTVENLAAHGHNALKFRVARKLDRAESGVAPDDIDFAPGYILRAAVDKLLHAVGNIQSCRSASS